jgi:type II secretory pathway component PulK
VSDANISVSSQFFMVTGRARFGNAQVTIQALLQRGASAWPAVKWQSVQ